MRMQIVNWNGDVPPTRLEFVDQHDGEIVATPVDMVKSEHIVKCVNLHDELVEAVKELIYEVREAYETLPDEPIMNLDPEGVPGRKIAEAEAVLAKVNQ